MQSTIYNVILYIEGKGREVQAMTYVINYQYEDRKGQIQLMTITTKYLIAFIEVQTVIQTPKFKILGIEVL